MIRIKELYILLRQFLFERLISILLFLICVILFVLIFSLYDLPVEAVLYAYILCSVVFIVAGIFQFKKYCDKHKLRQKQLENISLCYDDLPDPVTLAEQDVYEMIKKLGIIYNNSVTQSQTWQKESIDYYSAWIHQIKTPISVMKMQLQSKDTAENRSLLAELFRIEQYTEMALTYLRLDSPSSDLVIKEYDLDDIIRQAVRKYASQFVMRKIKLIYYPVSVSVLTDEKWLLFLIEQLLSNAIKYTKQGSVTITVTSQKVLKISDTGIGIAPEDLPCIFEKGFTGYNGRADKKSTGLGLYLCKQAAEKISVGISAESEVGKGSVFSVDLYKPPLWVE